MKQTFNIMFWVNQDRGTKGYCKCGETIRYEKGKKKTDPSFWIHENKDSKCKEVKVQTLPINPLTVRVTLNGVRTNFSSKEHISPDRWDGTKVTGNKAESAAINVRLKEIDQQLWDIYRNTKDATAETIKNKFLNVIVKTEKVTTLFQCYDSVCQAQKNKDAAHNSLESFKNSKNFFKRYLKEKYGKTDILLEDIDMAFCLGYATFANESLERSSVVTYFVKFTTTYNHALLYGYIPFSKIAGFKISSGLKKETAEVKHKKKMEKELSPEELESVVAYWEKQPIHSPHRVYLNMFLFAVEQGPAYGDVLNIKEENISVGLASGRAKLMGYRIKNGEPYESLLSARAIAIIAEMKTYPRKRVDYIFHKVAYQTYTSGLKAIAKTLGIKNMTSHMARHMCGAIKLNQGWSIEAVAKILGHKNTIITQNVYAYVKVTRLEMEIEEIEAKMAMVLENKARKQKA